MKELSLHLLDIVENSVSAHADTIKISVEENFVLDKLRMTVTDNGCGMDAMTVTQIVDPFFTSRTTRKVGLGIPLLKAAAESCKGGLRVQSKPGQGTTIEVEFQHSHIDRMPLGNLSATILMLVIGTPEIHWIFNYTVNNQTFDFSDEPIKETLDGIPLSDPLVLGYLREFLEKGIESVQQLKQSSN